MATCIPNVVKGPIVQETRDICGQRKVHEEQERKTREAATQAGCFDALYDCGFMVPVLMHQILESNILFRKNARVPGRV